MFQVNNRTIWPPCFRTNVFRSQPVRTNYFRTHPVFEQSFYLESLTVRTNLFRSQPCFRTNSLLSNPVFEQTLLLASLIVRTNIFLASLTVRTNFCVIRLLLKKLFSNKKNRSQPYGSNKLSWCNFHSQVTFSFFPQIFFWC
jgi:hypothetical protein